MLLCVVFGLQVCEVQFVRLRVVHEEQEKDQSHSQRVDKKTDVCLCSDYTTLCPTKTFLFVFFFLRQKYLPNTFSFPPKRAEIYNYFLSTDHNVMMDRTR